MINQVSMFFFPENFTKLRLCAYLQKKPNSSHEHKQSTFSCDEVRLGTSFFPKFLCKNYLPIKNLVHKKQHT